MRCFGVAVNTLRTLFPMLRTRGLLFAALYTLCFLLALYLVLPVGEFIFFIGLLLTYMVSPAGKETIIPMAIGYGSSWWFVAIVFTAFDLLGSLFVALNFDLLVKIPHLGPWMHGFIAQSQAYLEKNPWVGKLYYLAIVIYEMLLDGSAGITGSLLGRIMGMSPMETVVCILTGSLLGCFLFARASDLITSIVPRDRLLIISFAVFIGLTLFSFAARYLRNLKER
ncbi:MAG: small multi-drug export protein [Methanomicrobiales archaeon]|nr:small multi-drug export protein [Methanomicrobiales archaeon]